MSKLPKLRDLERMAQNNGKGFTRELLAEWGVDWPPRAGWLQDLKRKILAGAGDKIIRNGRA